MYKDLLKNICEKEGLVDIGHLGKASQSSYSKWSYDDDAQRAVDGNEYPDFAFHTDKELEPWWRLDFDRVYQPQYIIISNRGTQPFDRLASKIKIEVITDDDKQISLHSGQLFFKSVRKGMPLILPLAGAFNVKSILISSDTKEHYLHLSKIMVLTRQYDLSLQAKPIFFAKRPDGLGERLRALLNAMVLADYTEGSFYFSWNKSKSYPEVTDLNKLFDGNFLKKHLLERDYIDKLNLNLVRRLKFIDALEQSDYEGFIADRNDNIQGLIENSGLTYDVDKYKEAFLKVGFSQKIKQVIDYVNNIKLNKKSVAIHLRSGDVVYGNIRRVHGFMEKIIPVYILEELIVNFQSKGYEVLIFGQDNSFIEYLKEKFNVVSSLDLIEHPYSMMEEAIFDIVLMSRCQRFNSPFLRDIIIERF